MIISADVKAIAIHVDTELCKKDIYKAITEMRSKGGNLERECMRVEWEQGVSPDPDYVNVTIRAWYKTELVAPETTVFTFGDDHLNVDGKSLSGKFVVLSGVSDAENRARMQAFRGSAYCDGYQASDISELIAEGYLEVPVSQIVLNK